MQSLCNSTVQPGLQLAGTQLTVRQVTAGYTFSIRTPGLSTRSAAYEAELDHWWDVLTQQLTKPEGTDAKM